MVTSEVWTKALSDTCSKVFSNARNLFQRQRPTLKLVTKEYRNARFSLTRLSHLHQVSSLRDQTVYYRHRR